MSILHNVVHIKTIYPELVFFHFFVNLLAVDFRVRYNIMLKFIN